MLADLHTHSMFSFDGAPTATLDNMASRAMAAGLTHLAVTDHCDINNEIEGVHPIPDREALYAAITAAKEKYRGKLHILFGIEMGEATQYPTEALALLERYPYDIVLGSLHNIKGEGDFYWFDFSKYTRDEAHAFFDRVIEETMELCDFPHIRVITHLTYMERYMYRQGLSLDYAHHREELCRLFDRMIEKKLVLELNTSDLATGYALPPAPLLALYRERGGTRVCIGSDAHEPSAIARNFKAAKELLLSVGFDTLTIPTKDDDITYPIEKEA